MFGQREEALRVKESIHLLTECLLALGIAATMAIACKAQDFPPQPGPSPGSVSPILPQLSNQDSNPGIPVLEQSDGRLPPVSSLPEQVPITATPSPDLAGKNNEQRESGDMMGFGDRGGMEGFGGSMFPSDAFRYGAIWFPNVLVQGQATQFQMIGEDLSFTHPLWTDPLNALSISGGVRNRLIETNAILPDTGQAIPSDLWSVHLGLRYARQLENGWTAGGGVSIGSASDHPFASIREMNVSMNAMLRMPQGEHNAWLFSLMYSPTGELNFPVPGVAFSWNPSPQFHANIGLPFQVTWRPTDEWQFQASYMLIHTIHLKAQYRFTDRWSAFAAYDWSNEAYSLLDRPEDNDRFFIYDQRVSMGLQARLFRHWTASVSAGYVFDRYLFEGTSFSSSSSNRVNLGDGPFASLNLGVRY
jgi:hypothetical protein